MCAYVLHPLIPLELHKNPIKFNMETISYIFLFVLFALAPKHTLIICPLVFSTFQSRTSLVSSSDGGILAEGETSSETSRGTDECPPCDLGLMERLLLTHPVWFLPGIQRSGAVHFLQGKEEGVSR